MGLLDLLGLTFLFVCSNAFFFNNRIQTATSDGRQVDQTCLAKADAGDCGFYECFEQRLPCGRDGYMVRSAQYYCNKIEREKPSFSEEGQQFLDDSKRCMMQRLKEHYQREYTDCHDLEHDAVASITPCFVDYAFCHIFREESGKFFNIYESSDLFRPGAAKVWREMFSLASSCSTELAAQAGSAISQSLDSMVNTLSDAASTHGAAAVNTLNDVIDDMGDIANDARRRLADAFDF